MAKKDKKQNGLHLTLLLDETGSMDSIREATISGYNEFLAAKQKEFAGRAVTITLIQFNAQHTRTVFSGALADAPALTEADYRPNHMTPLYDAVGWGIAETDKMAKKGTDVLFWTISDGLENISKRYGREQIFEMVTKRQAKGWLFGYIGADIDTWGMSKSLGNTHVANVMTVPKDEAGIKSLYASMSVSTSRYANDASTVRRRGLFSK